MRQIGTLPDESQARRLADYLETLNITTRLDGAPSGWVIWVHDENRLDTARSELDAFLQNPNELKYLDAATSAKAIRKRSEQIQREHVRQSVYLRDRWLHRSPRKIPLTLTLIAVSIAAFLLGAINLNVKNKVYSALEIASFQVPRVEEQGGKRWDPTLWREHFGDLTEIRQGQVWRLATPMFLHFSILHLVFNMFWLAELGSQIENVRGTWRLAGLVLVTAICSNVVQFLWDGPFFGGMSGVVYALFGYTWMKTHYEPNTLFRLRANTVPTMIIWLLLCTTGVLGPIADAAHIAGLLSGMAMGVAPHARDALRPW